MRPGAIVHTRMPTAARSRAAVSVSATTPPFDAEYAAWPIWPSYAAIDAVFDDDAALAVLVGSFRRHARRREPQHVERADQVDLEHLAERVERVRVAGPVERAFGPPDARAVDARAQRPELGRGGDRGARRRPRS